MVFHVLAALFTSKQRTQSTFCPYRASLPPNPGSTESSVKLGQNGTCSRAEASRGSRQGERVDWQKDRAGT